MDQFIWILTMMCWNNYSICLHFARIIVGDALSLHYQWHAQYDFEKPCLGKSSITFFLGIDLAKIFTQVAEMDWLQIHQKSRNLVMGSLPNPGFNVRPMNLLATLYVNQNSVKFVLKKRGDFFVDTLYLYKIKQAFIVRIP